MAWTVVTGNIDKRQNDSLRQLIENQQSTLDTLRKVNDSLESQIEFNQTVIKKFQGE